MFPKVGDIVKLNPDFLKIWFRRGNKSLGKEVCEKSFTITGIKESFKDRFLIDFKCETYESSIYILPSGDFSSWWYEYKGIQVFIPDN